MITIKDYNLYKYSLGIASSLGGYTSKWSICTNYDLGGYTLNCIPLYIVPGLHKKDIHSETAGVIEGKPSYYTATTAGIEVEKNNAYECVTQNTDVETVLNYELPYINVDYCNNNPQIYQL